MHKPPAEAGRNGGAASRTPMKIQRDLVYKVVELSLVTDETIEEQLNRWTPQGWHFESVHFVVRENSRRPSMAFLFFVQERETRTE